MILFFDFSLKSKYEISLKRFAIAKNTCALAYDEAMMGHACMEEGYSLIICRKSLLFTMTFDSNDGKTFSVWEDSTISSLGHPNNHTIFYQMRFLSSPSDPQACRRGELLRTEITGRFFLSW